jgi:hypothetical protein
VDATRIANALEALVSDSDFAGCASELVDTWVDGGVGREAVDPILRFMESHPELDYGMPGGLVHFVERFHRRGYEQLLLPSIARRPTSHTLWMLNRLINGTHDAETRRSYVQAMRSAAIHQLADAEAREQARGFLAESG